MGEKLPGVNGPGQRIQITEDDLGPASAPMTAASSQRSSAPVAPRAKESPIGKAPAVAPAAPATQRPPTPPADATLPVVAGAKASPAGPIAPNGNSYCSGCGSTIHPQAVVCPRCGVATASAAQATGAAMAVALNSKSAGLAILLSLVFTGAGHWYVGRIGRGIAFFAAAFVSGLLILAVVGLFLLPIVWVWAAIDANKCAQQHNQLLLASAGARIPPAALTG